MESVFQSPRTRALSSFWIRMQAHSLVNSMGSDLANFKLIESFWFVWRGCIGQECGFFPSASLMWSNSERFMLYERCLWWLTNPGDRWLFFYYAWLLSPSLWLMLASFWVRGSFSASLMKRPQLFTTVFFILVTLLVSVVHAYDWTYSQTLSCYRIVYYKA